MHVKIHVCAHRHTHTHGHSRMVLDNQTLMHSARSLCRIIRLNHEGIRKALKKYDKVMKHLKPELQTKYFEQLKKDYRCVPYARLSMHAPCRFVGFGATGSHLMRARNWLLRNVHATMHTLSFKGRGSGVDSGWSCRVVFRLRVL